MTIAGVEDFIAFTHARHLNYLPGAGRLRQAYRIEARDGLIVNDCGCAVPTSPSGVARPPPRP